MAGLGVPQVERALPVTDRLIGPPGVVGRDLERVEDGEILAVALEVPRRLHDRLVVAFQIGQRRDPRLLQPSIARLVPVQLFGEDQCRLPIAFLKERIEQQFPGNEILRIADGDGAQLDDRFIVFAGPQQRANGVITSRRLRKRPAQRVGHRRLWSGFGAIFK
ncbi:hypothetical protein V1277_002322 [Bradyrhizobium sp. AZCC 1588]